jgi:hypothetical protein
MSSSLDLNLSTQLHRVPKLRENSTLNRGTVNSDDLSKEIIATTSFATSFFNLHNYSLFHFILNV